MYALCKQSRDQQRVGYLFLLSSGCLRKNEFLLTRTKDGREVLTSSVPIAEGYWLIDLSRAIR